MLTWLFGLFTLGIIKWADAWVSGCTDGPWKESRIAKRCHWLKGTHISAWCPPAGCHTEEIICKTYDILREAENLKCYFFWMLLIFKFSPGAGVTAILYTLKQEYCTLIKYVSLNLYLSKSNGGSSSLFFYSSKSGLSTLKISITCLLIMCFPFVTKSHKEQNKGC